MSPEKVYQMDFNRVYPLLVAKAERKGRTQEEVDEIICWLTGYSQEQIQDMDLCQYFGQKKLKDYADFFSSSSSLCCGVI